MQKIIINKCFGGFSVSATAVARYAELKGEPCHFFLTTYDDGKSTYTPCTLQDAEEAGLAGWDAFKTPTAPSMPDGDEWSELSEEERVKVNQQWTDVSWTIRDFDRNDPILVQVVEELGEAASGRCAELAIVEIPDGVEWQIEEYDGMEHIAEKHRVWS